MCLRYSKNTGVAGAAWVSEGEQEIFRGGGPALCRDLSESDLYFE